MARVSIGVPVYNGARYLAEALDSIVSQTYRDLEIVIGDNASTDATEEICRDYASRDPRIVYRRHPRNLGASANYNFVFDRSSGELFKWAAHDDVLGPRLVELCVDAFDREGPELVVAHTRTRLIDEAGRTIRDFDDPIDQGGETAPERLRRMLLVEGSRSLLNMCFPVFGLIRSEALRRTGRIRNFPRSDTVLLVELGMLGRFVELPEYEFLRRTHAHSSVLTAEAGGSAAATEKALAAWYDPSRGDRYPMTRSRLALGFLGAIRRGRMGPVDRAHCLGVFGRWFGRNFRIIGGDLKLGLRDWLRSAMRS
jgi:glycosyltransferase involved in cell wall biosynthesis